MIREKMINVLLYVMFPSALAYNLVAHAAGVAWDGYWEMVHFIRTGGRG